ncbi:MAG TPA: hypothetical protein VFP58_02330 [Candidatus Eisenbacteria bacterium]|nr:hypothetical protein [Candidatus Eisenbacteria bacterium]
MRLRLLTAAMMTFVVPSVPAGPARVEGASTSSPLEVVYEGVLDLEGHYARPGDTRRFRSRQRFQSDRRGNVLLDWTTWPEGDSAGSPESYLRIADRIFQRDDPTSSWRELKGMRLEQSRSLFTGSAPIPARTGRERSGPPRDVLVSRAHPRLGDVLDRTLTVYATHADPLPDSIGIDLHERDHQWKLQAKRVSSRDIPDSLLAVPAKYEPASESPDSLQGRAVLRKIAHGVWAVDMEDIDSRSLVVEFAEHLAIIEAAVSSANGERIVDAVKRQWPSKPIRFALFSHHHPHYVGGLRALIAEGAAVVTTPGNDSLVHAIAGYRFDSHPDRLSLSPKPASVLPFPARIELHDATNHLVAVNIGERSQHTAEFAVFWLPRQKLLFESEQGWFTVNGVLRAGRRASKLLEILKDENLDVDRIVQSWPMRGTEPEMSTARLAELVGRRR